MVNLKKARDKNDLESFISKHEKDAPADKARLEETIDRLSQGKKKSAQGTSEKDSGES